MGTRSARTLTIGLMLLPSYAFAADLVSLTPATYDEYVPAGKETDAIYGDYALRNNHVVVIVGDAVEGRKANMLTRYCGGQIIDLTSRQWQSDQLGAYYAGPVRIAYDFASAAVDGTAQPAGDRHAIALHGKTVTLTVANDGSDQYPQSRVHYSVSDDAGFVTVETEFFNQTSAPLTFELTDSVRMDQSGDRVAVAKANDGTADRFWLYDPWFGQAYAVVAEALQISAQTGSDGRAASKLIFGAEPGATITLQPGASHRLVRFIAPAPTLLEAHSIANRLNQIEQRRMTFRVRDSNDRAISAAEIELFKGDTSIGFGRTRNDGSLSFELPV
jgi:hypothetical protein